MLYVLDTSSFIVLGHYYPDRFPTFWADLNTLADDGRLLSVSEVWKELDNHNTREHLTHWLNARSSLFSTPASAEMEFVARVFAVPAFQALVKQKNRWKGSPVADPWVVARAVVHGGCVVTEEGDKPNTIRIPTVCSHFSVPCTDLGGLMDREDWQY